MAEGAEGNEDPFAAMGKFFRSSIKLHSCIPPLQKSNFLLEKQQGEINDLLPNCMSIWFGLPNPLFRWLLRTPVKSCM